MTFVHFSIHILYCRKHTGQFYDYSSLPPPQPLNIGTLIIVDYATCRQQVILIMYNIGTIQLEYYMSDDDHVLF
jgi:hypothetical protein